MVSQTLHSGVLNTGQTTATMALGETCYTALSFQSGQNTTTEQRFVWVEISLNGTDYIKYKLINVPFGVSYVYLDDMVASHVRIVSASDFNSVVIVCISK